MKIAHRKASELSCMPVGIYTSVNENIDDVMLNLSTTYTAKEHSIRILQATVVQS